SPPTRIFSAAAPPQPPPIPATTPPSCARPCAPRSRPAKAPPPSASAAPPIFRPPHPHENRRSFSLPASVPRLARPPRGRRLLRRRVACRNPAARRVALSDRGRLHHRRRHV